MRQECDEDEERANELIREDVGGRRTRRFAASLAPAFVFFVNSGGKSIRTALSSSSSSPLLFPLEIRKTMDVVASLYFSYHLSECPQQINMLNVPRNICTFENNVEYPQRDQHFHKQILNARTNPGLRCHVPSLRVQDPG